MMEERIALTAARAVAHVLGGTVDAGEPGETWRAWVQLPDGLRLMFAEPYRSKGEIRAYLPRPGKPGESGACGMIGVDLTRDPVKLARDIERRLLPAARVAAQNLRDNWARLDSESSNIDSLAEAFAAIPGVWAQVANRGRTDQRIEVRYYESEKGSLTATIYGRGSVSVERARIHGGADRLRAVIDALRG